jgi:hypothetical protein
LLGSGLPNHGNCLSPPVSSRIIPSGGGVHDPERCLGFLQLEWNSTLRQIKQLQQDSRNAQNAQMKNDLSWAQQHLADGFMAGNSWGSGRRRTISLRIRRPRRTSGRAATSATCRWRLRFEHRGSTLRFTYEAELKDTIGRPVICSNTWVNDSGTWKPLRPTAR